MITYGKIIFWTCTYSRDRLLDSCWCSSNTDFNRFIQKLRRLSKDSIQYLRTVESHADGYPHFHAILRFSTVLTINHGRYFESHAYRQWKQSWPHGLSDAQPPRPGQSALAYIIKYTTKSSGLNIWKKYYQTLDVPSAALKSDVSSTIPVTFSAKVATPLSITCDKYKIKQCTWSRNFFKPYKKPDSISLVSLDDGYTK